MSLFKRGNIGINKDVIAEIAVMAALKCEGVAGISSKTKGISGLLKRESAIKGVDVSILNNNSVSAVIHIIVEYGVNITTVGENVCHTAEEELKNAGIEVENIKVIAEGIRQRAEESDDTPVKREEDIISSDGDEIAEELKKSFEYIGIIKKQDEKYIAFSDGAELLRDENPVSCIDRLTDIISESGENTAVAALYYSKNAESETAEEVINMLSEKYKEADTEIHYAENMEYEYIIGVD